MGLLDFLLGRSSDARFDERVHSRDPRERAAARQAAIDVLTSDASTTERLRALATLRAKATLGVLDDWSESIVHLLCDTDARVAQGAAELISDCVSHGIAASDVISAVAMMVDDATRIRSLLISSLSGVSDRSVNELVQNTIERLNEFIKRKTRE